MNKVTLFTMGVVCVLTAARAEAAIVINEILADPPAGLAGDANNDGVGSTSQDEFVELVNTGPETVNLSGWQLADAVKPRHTFLNNTFLAPFAYLVVFGGGAPDLPGIHWQTATSGSLGLNNSGDTVTLLDNHLSVVDMLAYDGLAGKNQSIIRTPEGTGEDFVLHTSLGGQDTVLYSPGKGSLKTSVKVVDPGHDANAVPEPTTLFGWLMAAAGVILRKNVITS